MSGGFGKDISGLERAKRLGDVGARAGAICEGVFSKWRKSWNLPGKFIGTSVMVP